jgi:hypothetical protein
MRVQARPRTQPPPASLTGHLTTPLRLSSRFAAARGKTGTHEHGVEAGRFDAEAPSAPSVLMGPGQRLRRFRDDKRRGRVRADATC